MLTTGQIWPVREVQQANGLGKPRAMQIPGRIDGGNKKLNDADAMPYSFSTVNIKSVNFFVSKNAQLSWD